jgi:putative PEP-CTERM system TPR-repeat lipoprotein
MMTSCARTPEERYARAIEKGKKLLAEKEYARAALEFHNAAQAKPKSVEALYLLGETAMNQVLLPTAISFYRKAADLDPKYGPAQLRLADLMLRTHNDQLTKEAESRIQKVLTGNPEDDDALLALATIRVQLGKIEDAEKYLNEVVQRSPTNLKSAIALAQVKLAQKDYKGAEQVLKQTVERSPGSPDAVTALGALYAGTGRLPESEGMFRKAVLLDPRNAGALAALAELQMRMGKPIEAEKSYKAVAAIPGTGNTLAYALFLMRQNRRPESVLELERLSKANPNDRIARTALIAGYLATDRIASAESVLNAVLKENGKDQEALIQRSQIYLRKGQVEQAQKDIEAILSFDSSSAQGHYLLAKVHRAQGNSLRQRDELSLALRIAPESLAARFDLVDSLLMANNPSAALATLDGAQQPQKHTLRYLLVHNWALIAAGKADEARGGVDSALAVANTPEALLQDGLLKLAKQDFAGSRTALELALNATPEDLRPLTLLVQSYVAQKQIPAATEKIRQAVAKRPKSLALQMYLARWLVQNGQSREAMQAGAAAALADPNSSAPPLLLALLNLSNGKLDDARGGLMAVLAKEPRNVDAHMSLGMVEDASGAYSKAIGEYKKILDLESRHLGALNNLAYDLARDPARCDEALPYAQKAKELAPAGWQIQDTLGWIYYRKGLYDNAAREFEGALSNGGGALARLHLGQTYNRLGDSVRGGRFMAAALVEDPKLAVEPLDP